MNDEEIVVTEDQLIAIFAIAQFGGTIQGVLRGKGSRKKMWRLRGICVKHRGITDIENDWLIQPDGSATAINSIDRGNEKRAIAGLKLIKFVKYGDR